MTNLLADVRLALRSWRKAPGFAGIAILSIALGIGANAAIFTLVDQVLLRVLPVRDSHELVQVTFTGSRYGNNWGDGTELSYPVYKEIRDNNQVFQGVFARFGTAVHVGAAGRTERVAGEAVSGNYFPVLGVRAALGRTIAEDDDRVPGGHPVAVLSHGFWSSRFAADPAVVGHARSRSTGIRTRSSAWRDRASTASSSGRQTQVFVPLMMKAQITPTWNALDERLWRWVKVFARLQPGVSREQARAALEPFFKTVLERDLADRGFATAAPTTRQRYLDNRLSLPDASQGRSGLRRSLTTPLWLLMATAAGVLLIACANIANLLLARGAARQREMAVRLALGATRTRLVTQLLVESLMLAGAGALGGLAIARRHGADRPRLLRQPGRAAADLDRHPTGASSPSPRWSRRRRASSSASRPALQSTRPNVAPTLKDQATSVLGGQGRLRKALVASQIAVSLLLLIGAALFLRTLDNLLAVDIGFETSRLALVQHRSVAERLRCAEACGSSRTSLLERLQPRARRRSRRASRASACSKGISGTPR